MSENETTPVVEEPTIKKTTLLKNKIKRAALTAGFYGTTVGVTAGSLYYSVKVMQMNYETAKMNLESAKQIATTFAA